MYFKLPLILIYKIKDQGSSRLKFALVSWEGRFQSLLTTRSGILHPTSESGKGYEPSSESARIEALS